MRPMRLVAAMLSQPRQHDVFDADRDETEQQWVLVADDDAHFRTALRHILEDAGYSVLEAGDGQAALDLLRISHHPLVALLDSHLPRLDGPGVLAALAGDDSLANRHACILLLGGTGTGADTAQAPAAPVAPQGLQMLPPLAVAQLLSRLHGLYLPKPVDSAVLLRIVAHAALQLRLPLPPHFPVVDHHSTPR